MAEALAGEIDRPILKVNIGDLAAKFINETTENLVAMFKSTIESPRHRVFYSSTRSTRFFVPEK